jgi:hypothetical protein
VKHEKLRTQVSREITLRRPTVGMDHTGNARDIPASEGIGALKIQLGTFLYKALAVSPTVYSIFEIGVQDFHS